MVEVRLRAVRVDLQSNTPVLLLQETEGLGRTLPIFIGAPEAFGLLEQQDRCIRLEIHPNRTEPHLDHAPNLLAEVGTCDGAVPAPTGIRPPGRAPRGCRAGRCAATRPSSAGPIGPIPRPSGWPGPGPPRRPRNWPDWAS